MGDHVERNVYVRDFPRGVPDTVESWNDVVLDGLKDESAASTVRSELRRGFLNLLSLAAEMP